mmetsp:Transcript_6100/g.18406  ORF Transcript_6100/g.18406 Transcript_6100/m.18406 type:complete len:255 (+) Transcript_6100:1112-1876(+)
MRVLSRGSSKVSSTLATTRARWMATSGANSTSSSRTTNGHESSGRRAHEAQTQACDMAQPRSPLVIGTRGCGSVVLSYREFSRESQTRATTVSGASPPVSARNRVAHASSPASRSRASISTRRSTRASRLMYRISSARRCSSSSSAACDHASRPFHAFSVHPNPAFCPVDRRYGVFRPAAPPWFILPACLPASTERHTSSSAPPTSSSSLSQVSPAHASERDQSASRERPTRRPRPRLTPPSSRPLDPRRRGPR